MLENRKSINLFDDKKVRCYKTVFNIINEEDLLQWWEYNLEQSIEEHQESIEFIHTLYRSCFNLLDKYKLCFDIIFEKSQENVYWTIWAKADLSSIKIIYSIFKNIEYKIDNERISFKMPVNKTKEKSHCTIPIIKQSQKKLTVYNFLEDDDSLTLVEINNELNDELVFLDGKGFCEESIDRIQKLISEYTIVLSSYQECLYIKNSVEELSYFMNENRSILINLDNSYISLFEGLIINLQKWYEEVFVTGTYSIEAYKDSIYADVKIIKTMTIQTEIVEDIEFF